MLFKHVIQKLFIVVHGSFLQCNVPLYDFPEAQYLLGVCCILISLMQSFFQTTLLQGISGIVNVYTYFTMSFDLALSMPCCMSEVAGRDLLVL